MTSDNPTSPPERDETQSDSAQEVSLTSSDSLSQSEHVDLIRELLRRHANVSALLSQDTAWVDSLCQALPLSMEERAELAEEFPKLQYELSMTRGDHPYLTIAQRADHADSINQMLTAYLHHLARSPEDHKSRLKVARILIDRGEIDAARQLAQVGALLDPSPLLIALEAELALAKQDYVRALQLSELALESGAEDPDVLITYALCLGWTGEESLELNALERAHTIDPDHIHVRTHRWSCALISMDPIKTLREVEETYRHDSRRIVHQALVSASLSACQFSNALSEARALVERHPRSVSGQLTLASALFHQAELEESLLVCEALFERGVNTPSLCFIWLMGSIALNETALATADLDALKHAINIQGQRLAQLQAWGERSPRVALWHAQLLEVLDREPEAYELSLTTTRGAPRSVSAQLHYIKSALHRGLFEESESLLSQLLRSHPEHLEAWLLSAELKFQRGHELGSLEDLERCGNLPNARELMLRILIKRGAYADASQLALGLYQEAPAQSAYLEYVINSIWQDERLDEEQVKSELFRLFELTSIESQPSTLLSLFAYLFLHLHEVALAQKLFDLIDQNERHAERPLKLFRRQRLKFVCELAHQLRQHETLERWSAIAVERYPEAGDLQFYRAISQWHLGRHELAFEMGLDALNAQSESEVSVEHLIIASVWSCELGRYETSSQILEHLERHLDTANEEHRALSIRTLLNLRHTEALARAIEDAQLWLTERPDPERFESLIDWSLESIVRHVERGALSTVDVEDFDGSGDLIGPEPLEGTGDLEELGEDASRTESSNWVADHELLSCALSWAEEATQLFPEEAELWRRLSFVFNLQDQVEGAIFAQKRVIELNGGTSFDWLSLAHLYESNLQLNLAHHAFNQMIASASELEAIDHIGYTQLALERACFLLRCQSAAPANAAFEELLKRVTDAPDQGEGDELYRSTSTMLQLSDDAPLYTHEVVFIWLAHAFEHLEPSVVSELTRSLYMRFSYPFVSGFYGLTLIYAEEHEAAIPLLARGYEYDLYFGIEYAGALWVTSRRRTALDVLFECVARRPDDLECKRALITMLIEARDGESALEHLRSLRAASPNDSTLEDLQRQVNALLVIH